MQDFLFTVHALAFDIETGSGSLCVTKYIQFHSKRFTNKRISGKLIIKHEESES